MFFAEKQGFVSLAHNLRKYVAHKAKIRENRKALTERGRPRPRERLPKERSSEGWMKRSGTLAEPSDNSSSPYRIQETDPFGSASSKSCMQAINNARSGRSRRRTTGRCGGREISLPRNGQIPYQNSIQLMRQRNRSLS